MARPLPIDEDKPFQERMWIVQRVGWVCLALFLVIMAQYFGYGAGIVRSAGIYLLVLVVLRLAGRRSVGEMTTFDLALLLIVSEATQEALINGDQSFAAAAVAIVTLIGLDILLSLVKRTFPSFDKVIEGRPTVLLAHGEPIAHALRKSRTDLNEVLGAARASRGVTALEEIEYAILEPDGTISIIPVRDQ